MYFLLKILKKILLKKKGVDSTCGFLQEKLAPPFVILQSRYFFVNFKSFLLCYSLIFVGIQNL
jgi:hypothetical protein